MHPGYIWYWKHRHRAGGPCGSAHVGMRSESTSHDRRTDWNGADWKGAQWTCMTGSRGRDAAFGSNGFGVRRPVRFLTERLDLDDKQVAQLGRIVERIRIEREQAAVDLRRAAGELADALEGSGFEDGVALTAGQRRIDAATSVQKEVARSLRELHELLDAEQREELAALIRTGAVRF